MQVNICASVCM